MCIDECVSDWVLESEGKGRDRWGGGGGVRARTFIQQKIHFLFKNKDIFIYTGGFLS